MLAVMTFVTALQIAKTCKLKLLKLANEPVFQTKTSLTAYVPKHLERFQHRKGFVSKTSRIKDFINPRSPH